MRVGIHGSRHSIGVHELSSDETSEEVTEENDGADPSYVLECSEEEEDDEDSRELRLRFLTVFVFSEERIFLARGLMSRF